MDKEEKNMDGSTLGTADNDMVVMLKKPIEFEGERYDRIDLAGLHDVRAADMVAINRRMARNGNTDVNPELSLEYALNMANIATGLPLEFFDQLPPYAALAVRNRVTGFLFRQE